MLRSHLHQDGIYNFPPSPQPPKETALNFGTCPQRLNNLQETTLNNPHENSGDVESRKVARSLSAYDMQISDVTYGKAKRYVTQDG